PAESAYRKHALSRGLVVVYKTQAEAEVEILAVADGGEGTVDALIDSLGGHPVECRVAGPLGSETTAVYGISGDGTTAVMEMARASGITLIEAVERNPLYTSTLGTGQMIANALRRGCRTVMMGIGGSATNDGGMGMLAALGARFYDAGDNLLVPCGESLEKVARVDLSGLMPESREARFLIACDVDNPLCGERGASYVYGPQKGADALMVERLDRGMAVYARALAAAAGRDCAEMPGAGAAGGLGFAFATVFKAELRPGIELVLDLLHFDDVIAGASLVVTGEGRMDRQTVMGKAPWGIMQRAARYEIPVIAVTGSVSDADVLAEAGFAAVFPVVSGPCSLEYAMLPDVAAGNLRRTAEMFTRIYLLKK
ncbi:MAG: glycerate kinase, partial [Muribaculaceae bacterium]|nr:glycerate kinase [Muribaculaceae bacterium]